MSNIEWTDTTWQVTSGCTKVSAGCTHCYAETMANRLAGMARADEAAGRNPGHKASYPLVVRDNGLWNGKVVTLPDRLTDPLHWRKPRRAFVNSMSDLFHADVPFEFIDRVFAVMALCPQHTFQVLTKRPERMAEYLAGVAASRLWDLMHDEVGEDFPPGVSLDDPPWPLPNVWAGTSVENQTTANERIPHLLRCPAVVRFLSCEPLLGPIDLPSAVVKRRYGDPQPNWVIVGGESGHHARPCDVKWIKSIVRQCRDADVPCFVKQLGARPYDTSGPGLTLDTIEEVINTTSLHLHDRKGGDPSEWPENIRVREWPQRAELPA